MMAGSRVFSSLNCFLCVFLFSFGLVQASSPQHPSLQWSKDSIPPLPNSFGFAGGYAALLQEGSQRYLLFCGGANFPYTNPFDEDANAQNKQPKIFSTQSFLLPLAKKGLTPKEGATWQATTSLPLPLAYGASISLESGKALFIGGENDNGPSDAVFLISLKNGQLTFDHLPPLFQPLTGISAASIDSKVYLFSGDNTKGSQAQFLCLDIANTNPQSWRWSALPWPKQPSGAPARARGFYSVGTMGKNLYIFGGRSSTDASDTSIPDEDRNTLHGQDFFRDCYVFHTQKKTWEPIASLPLALSAAPQCAIPAGESHLIMLGGVSVPFLKELFENRQKLGLNDNAQGFSHPGFPKNTYAYHTITDTWSSQSPFPLESPTAVTAPVIVTKGHFAILSGEWSPKLRTPTVLKGTILQPVAHFGWINWTVVGIYLLGMVGIGYWFMKKESASSTEAYFRGGQRIPWWVAGLSIFATMLSSLTFMGIPAQAYANDMTWYIGQWTILLVVPIVVFFYLPFFRNLNITSAYEYLESRFGLGVRLFASISFILYHVGRIAIVLYLPALAISAVTGIPVSWAIIIISILCIIYTVMGGIEAVVWTDAIQALVLLSGALLCLGCVIYHLDGGVAQLISIAKSDHKLFESLDWGNFSVADGTTSAIMLLIAFTFNSLVPYTSGQDVVQRYVTTSDMQSAKKSLWTTMWMSVFGSLIFFLLGVAIYAFYKTHPSMLAAGLQKTDQILPFYIVEELPIGISGLIIAAVFAASQSTISSSLNSSATTFIKDFDARLLRPNAEDKSYLKSAQIFVIILGIISTGVALIMARSSIEGAFKMFNTIIGLTAGSLGGLFFLGIFTRRANGFAAFIAAFIASGIVITLFICKVPITGILYATIGFLLCVFLGYVIGIFFPPKNKQLKGLTLSSPTSSDK